MTEELNDAYKTVGILLRAKINSLTNDRCYIQAEELQKCYDIINEYTNNSLELQNERR